jgi:hypothetical protein
MEAIAPGSATSVLPACDRALTPTGQAPGMAHSSQPDAVAYHGEVWTDDRGYVNREAPGLGGAT